MLAFTLILTCNSVGADPSMDYLLEAIRDATEVRVWDPMIARKREKITAVVDDETIDLLRRALSFDGRSYRHTKGVDTLEFVRFELRFDSDRLSINVFIMDRNTIRFAAPSPMSIRKSGTETFEIKLKPTKELTELRETARQYLILKQFAKD